MTENLSFQADVSKVLDIVVNSLYSHPEIFLRELISNASDACDKLRYSALLHPELTKDMKPFEITLTPDVNQKTLTLTDNGIGMDRHDLVNDLGTIANSGTLQFVQHMTGDKKKDTSLIGQFGVGFYSAFMVADQVDVITRKVGEPTGWHWESRGKGTFTLDEDKTAVPGTSITLHLKKDFTEYADPIRLRHVVRQYSDHISIPVVLVTKDGRETVNSTNALWARNKADISAEQYKDFYQHLTHSFDAPYMTLHYKAEGVIDYTALLFIPEKPPVDLFQPDKKHALNLYVNKVFISNEVTDLLPHYLRFVQGVIDTAELPLNVSREMLQHTPVLEKIKTGITKKILVELKKRASDSDYNAFWKSFGSVMKEGLYEDGANTKDLGELARFYSTHGDTLTSFKDYVSRMPKGQKNIYYLTGDDIQILRNNPQIEGFAARGIEVLLMADPIDEFWPQMFREFEGKPIRSITHPDADIEHVKRIDEWTGDAINEGLQKVLTDSVKQVLGTEVSDVRITDRLNKSPVALVAGKDQMSIHLERLMRQHGQQTAFASSRTLELNPRHPVIKKLAETLLAKKEADKTTDAIWVLYDQARAIEGEPLKDPAGFARRVNAFLESGL